MSRDSFSNLHVPTISTNRGLLSCLFHATITHPLIQRFCWTDKYHSSWWWNHDPIHPKIFTSWLPKHPVVIFRWIMSLICIVLPSTLSRPPTTPYPYPAQLRWTDWSHPATFTSVFTSSKPIKRNEIIAIRADHRVIMVVTVDGTDDSNISKYKQCVPFLFFFWQPITTHYYQPYSTVCKCESIPFCFHQTIHIKRILDMLNWTCSPTFA